METKAKVFVVDDSILSRTILTRAIEQIDDAECVGLASSGKTALSKIIHLKPDLVILDVMMPEMDGIETLSKLKEIDPNLQVVMISSADMKNVKNTLKSLQLGALDFISKPTELESEKAITELSRQISFLAQLVITKKYASFCRQHSFSSSPILEKKVSLELPSAPPVDLVVIGVSTGGPKALEEMLPSLGKNFPCPILIVQHMPPLFTGYLAERLTQQSAFQVKEGEHEEVIQKGTIYLAPGGKHLRVKKKNNTIVLLLDDTPPVNNCRPSVDVLFTSVAEAVQENILAVMMTGMGKDGTEGVRLLKQRKNNICLIQDEASSVVWGMPGSIYTANLADEVVPLKGLGKRILEILHQRKSE